VISHPQTYTPGNPSARVWHSSSLQHTLEQLEAFCTYLLAQSSGNLIVEFDRSLNGTRHEQFRLPFSLSDLYTRCQDHRLWSSSSHYQNPHHSTTHTHTWARTHRIQNGLFITPATSILWASPPLRHEPDRFVAEVPRQCHTELLQRRCHLPLAARPPELRELHRQLLIAGLVQEARHTQGQRPQLLRPAHGPVPVRRALALLRSVADDPEEGVRERAGHGEGRR